MNRRTRYRLLTAVLSVASAGSASASELAGSPASMRRQYSIARENELAFVDRAREVRTLVEAGKLERVVETESIALSKVSQPYARPEVRLFVDRLADQYKAATGARLVVTSLTRPAEAQPANAHRLSVHPAGMAVDLRVPSDKTQRAWLEETLLELEDAGVLDVTRERNPPHYHVAVFPAKYLAYVARVDSVKAIAAARALDSALSVSPRVVAPAPVGAPKQSALPLTAGLAGTVLLAVAVVVRRRRSAKV